MVRDTYIYIACVLNVDFTGLVNQIMFLNVMGMRGSRSGFHKVYRGEFTALEGRMKGYARPPLLMKNHPTSGMKQI